MNSDSSNSQSQSSAYGTTGLAFTAHSHEKNIPNITCTSSGHLAPTVTCYTCSRRREASCKPNSCTITESFCTPEKKHKQINWKVAKTGVVRIIKCVDSMLMKSLHSLECIFLSIFLTCQTAMSNNNSLTWRWVAMASVILFSIICSCPSLELFHFTIRRLYKLWTFCLNFTSKLTDMLVCTVASISNYVLAHTCKDGDAIFQFFFCFLEIDTDIVL